MRRFWGQPGKELMERSHWGADLGPLVPVGHWYFSILRHFGWRHAAIFTESPGDICLLGVKELDILPQPDKTLFLWMLSISKLYRSIFFCQLQIHLNDKRHLKQEIIAWFMLEMVKLHRFGLHPPWKICNYAESSAQKTWRRAAAPASKCKPLERPVI